MERQDRQTKSEKTRKVGEREKKLERRRETRE